MILSICMQHCYEHQYMVLDMTKPVIEFPTSSPITSLLSYKDYSKTCVKRPLSKRQIIGFQEQLYLNTGQKYCRMRILQYF